MQINFSPWYYRNLLSENNIIEKIEFFKVDLLDASQQYESSVLLKENLRPSWLSKSDLYRNTDGSGCADYKNLAVYKGISEALERWAFYETVDTQTIKYKFDINPSTTGMAAYPGPATYYARANARAEAIERWAIHEFNRLHLPIIFHTTSINNLKHFQIITPFNDISVSLLEFWNGQFYCYGFAGGINLKHSFKKALIELNRNLYILQKVDKNSQVNEFKDTVDRSLIYFSRLSGNQIFNSLIQNAPQKIANSNPKILCDLEIKGQWSSYTRVWRYLIENSYFDCRDDINFFMF